MSRAIEFVRGDVLRNVQGRLVERYGGLAGIRDENLLEPALARTKNLHAYEDEQRIPRLGAALAWAILRNHPFLDANKRAAFAALCIFLERNGYDLTCGEVEETSMVLRAASSEIAETEWIDWVEQVTAAR